MVAFSAEKKQSKMDNFLEPEGPAVVMNSPKSQYGNIPNTQSTHQNVPNVEELVEENQKLRN